MRDGWGARILRIYTDWHRGADPPRLAPKTVESQDLMVPVAVVDLPLVAELAHALMRQAQQPVWEMNGCM